MSELKITKDRVLAAAEKCPQAKETLKELFPDVFDNSVKVRESWFNDKIQVRATSSCNYYGRGFWLSNDVLASGIIL